MASKAFRTSLYERIGCRTTRALTSASATAASFRCSTCLAAIPHDGAHRSMTLVSIQVANASFSQMSSHHAAVTRSPNHW